MRPPQTISCPSCGGVGHLVFDIPEDVDLDPTVPVAYRCADCQERFDVVSVDDQDDPNQM